ncbi:hypothetical protein [Afipia sp. GAS231]|uniref:hypothetical protein n=1 Tax=Afipia sp. GAS231 TaxID=1882747 RepID=UPI00087BF043|nr:hypothetical protein [Afipia sp. GAS231]SDN38811.1 general secretion pathway protein N [Afipia sp. GAS231]
MLLSALGAAGSTSALPTDVSDIGADASRRGNAPSVSSPWDAPAAPAQVVGLPAVPERAPSANPLWGIPLASLSATRERPIFSVSRRPPPPAVASASVTKAPPPPPKPLPIERPQLSLVGTIASGDQGFGIFVDQTTKAALRLRIGDYYQGWKLRSVRGREVTLERDQETAILSLPQPGAVGQVRLPADNAIAQGSPGMPPERRGRR